MADDIVLDVEVRENTGTGGARASRRAGLVPGVLYGGGIDPVAISIKQNEVIRAINSGNLISRMVKIAHKGKQQFAITQDIQFHPVTDMPQHLDFYRVKESDMITIEVPVNFVGEDENMALRGAGTLNVVRYSVEVNTPAGSIPESLDVDVTELELGSSVHVSDIKFPEGISSAITDRDPTIASIMASRAETVDEVDEDEEMAIEGEGEAPAAEDGGEGED